MKAPPMLVCRMMWLLLLPEMAAAQQWDWVHRFQGDASHGRTIALDTLDNLYVAGEFTGTNQIGTNQLVSAGSSDIFLAKFSGNGDVSWAISLGGPGEDSVRRLLVATNGAIFLCGHFALGSSVLGSSNNGEGSAVSNVFLARLDEGQVSWFNSFTSATNGQVGSIAFGPDESLWLVAATDRVFVRRYAQDGTIHGSYNVGEDLFVPNGIAVNKDEQVFIHGRIPAGSVNLGTTNIGIANYNAYNIHFIAGLDNSGIVHWAWSPGLWISQGYPINAIACTFEGDLISVGSADTNLPQQWGTVVRHSPDGAVIWERAFGRYFKSFYSATGLTMDRRGNALVIGNGFDNPYYPRSRAGIWLFTVTPQGNLLFQQSIRSANRSDQNSGAAIAANDEGEIFITGQLMGTPMFGTNVMGAALGANAFVARRRTIQPELRIQPSGTNVVLHWPRPSMPFALQAAAGLNSSEWFDVAIAPFTTNESTELVLAASAQSRLFRLRMTNEAPIRHVPEILSVLIQAYPAFLGPEPTLVTASNSISAVPFAAAAEDKDEDSLTFQWFDATSGALLTNGITVTLTYTGAEQRPWYYVAMNDANHAFPLGSHTVSLVAFDGSFRVTNSVTFNVLSLSNAMDELIDVVQDTNVPDKDALLEPLNLAHAAVESRQWSVAVVDLTEFKARVQNSVTLSDEQKWLFTDSAQALVNALPSNGGPSSLLSASGY